MLRFSPTRGAASLVLNSMTRGPVGAAATIEIGTVTPLTPGATPTVSNTGSTAAAVLAFGIPTSKTVAVGATTTGAEGTNASVTDSGDASASIFDFTIPRGASPAIGYTFSTTTTDSDPGAGNVRFNNAAPASVTTIYFANADADGNAVTGWLDTFDDPTNTHKGYLTFTDVTAPSTKIVFNVTGSTVVDGTGYRKVTVTHAAGTTLFTNARRLAATFSMTGNKGLDGAISGSLGSTDNLGVRADGAGGTTLQAGLFINDDSGNLSPATNDTGALGTTSNKWADLFLATGAVINFNSGNMTITHSAGNLSYAGGTFSFPNAGLRLFDTDSSHYLVIIPGSNLTANRNFTLTTGDAARTLTLSGDHTLPGGTSAVLAGGQTLTGGFKTTPFAAGTKSSGTYTPLYSDGNFQTATNGGAHTLAPPADDCTMVIQYTNNGSAGAVTTSGFTKKTGDSITTVNGDDFFFYITKVGSFSSLYVQALQ